MTNSKILFDKLIQQLKMDETEDEIQAIAFEVLDHFGISRTDVLSKKETDFTSDQLNPIIERLNRNEPVQHILGEGWFCGHKFLVNKSVLIPRPETELLVEEVVKSFSGEESISILDIGTGSGCIAISIALMFPNASVDAIDISSEALTIAKQNALRLNAKVKFSQKNILEESLSKKYDLIVSNPPYIAEEEKPSLSKNVIDYEPHVALFAHKSDPLIFYKCIAQLANESLNEGGKIFAEINERFGYEIESIFRSANFSQVQIQKDFAGKDRLIIASY